MASVVDHLLQWKLRVLLIWISLMLLLEIGFLKIFHEIKKQYLSFWWNSEWLNFNKEQLLRNFNSDTCGYAKGSFVVIGTTK